MFRNVHNKNGFHAEMMGICVSRHIDLMKIKASSLKSTQSLKNAGFFNLFPGCSIDAALSALKTTNTHAVNADFSGTPTYLAASPVAKLKDVMCWTAYLSEFHLVHNAVYTYKENSTQASFFFRNYLLKDGDGRLKPNPFHD